MPRIKKTGTIHNTLTGYDFTKDSPLTPLKAIRMKCLECVCASPAEVSRCHIVDCTLWPWRSGHRQGHDKPKQPMSEEAKKRLADRLMKAHPAKPLPESVGSGPQTQDGQS